MASIKKRKTKKGYSYLITVSNGRKPDGTKIFETTTYKPDESMTPKQAEKAVQRYAQEFEDKVKNGKFLQGDKITLSAFTERWLDTHASNTLAQTTVEDYKRQLNNWILPYLGNYKMNKITLPIIEDFYQQILGQFKKSSLKCCGYSTIEKCNNILSSIFRTAVRWNVISNNPCKEACLPKPPATVQIGIKFFTPEQALIFLNALDKPYYSIHKAHQRVDDTGKSYYVEEYKERHNISTMFKVLFYIALFCGLRKGELLALTWNDINMENLTISISKSVAIVKSKQVIKTTKNVSSNRIISFPQYLLPLLKNYKCEQNQLIHNLGTYYNNPDGYLFTQDNGSIMHNSTPYHKLQKIIQNHNLTVTSDQNLSTKEKESLILPKIPFHGLRHSCATLLNYLGIDYVDIANKLGHSQVSTTMNIYLHSFQSQERRTSDKVDLFIAENSEKMSTVCLPRIENDTLQYYR